MSNRSIKGSIFGIKSEHGTILFKTIYLRDKARPFFIYISSIALNSSFSELRKCLNKMTELVLYFKQNMPSNLIENVVEKFSTVFSFPTRIVFPLNNKS